MYKMSLRPSRFFALFLLPGLLFSQVSSATQVLDYIVAVVNDEVVLSSELNQALSQVKQQLAGRGNMPDEDVLRRQVLERIIVTKAQVQRARQGGLKVSDQELNAAMSDIAQRNDMSLNKFALALRREGIDYLQLRKQVHDEILVNQLRQAEVDSSITVSDDDVDLLLEKQGDSDKVEYHLAHILIAVPSDSSPDARKAAEAEAVEVVSQARAGQDFSQLAVAHSDSPRALDGGDLGWRRGNALPTLFSDIVPQLSEGGISDPINASGGLHIVKLVEKRGAVSGKMVRETHAKHILLKPNILRNTQQTKEQLENIRQQIMDGADFAELARKHSEDPGSANQGGDMDWQGPETFVPEFQRALDVLEPGELSPVFQTPFGFHIAMVVERREKDRTQQLRRAQARQAIFRRKVSEEKDVWMRQLRDEAYVEYRDQPAAD